MVDAHIPFTPGAGIGMVSVVLAVLRSGISLGSDISERDAILTTDVGRWSFHPSFPSFDAKYYSFHSYCNAIIGTKYLRELTVLSFDITPSIRPRLGRRATRRSCECSKFGYNHVSLQLGLPGLY